MADVDGQSSLEDYLSYAPSLRIDLGNLAQLGDEAGSSVFGFWEISGTRLHDKRRPLVRRGAEADQSTTEDLRVLAESGLDGFRREVAVPGPDFFHPSAEEEKAA